MIDTALSLFLGLVLVTTLLAVPVLWVMGLL